MAENRYYVGGGTGEISKKKLISVFKSGEGTVNYNTDNLAIGEKISFTVVPAQGWYIKSITYNGKNEGNFDMGGTVYTSPPITKNSTLYVYFSKTENNAPAVFSTPYVFRNENDIFYIGRVYNGGGKAQEYGILMSQVDTEPDISLTGTVKIKSEYPAGTSGFFGFQLINKTGNDSIVCYIRPYAVYNGNIITADKTVRVALNKTADITEFKTYSQWLIHNMLEDTGVVRYIINKEGITEE